MLSAIGSPLVAGSAASPMATKHVEVIRSFYLAGAAQSVGSVIEVDAKFAVELVASNKAKIVDAPKPVKVEAKASTPEPTRRSSKNVG